jgi:hypothetical protein
MLLWSVVLQTRPHLRGNVTVLVGCLSRCWVANTIVGMLQLTMQICICSLIWNTLSKALDPGHRHAFEEMNTHCPPSTRGSYAVSHEESVKVRVFHYRILALKIRQRNGHSRSFREDVELINLWYSELAILEYTFSWGTILCIHHFQCQHRDTLFARIYP